MKNIVLENKVLSEELLEDYWGIDPGYPHPEMTGFAILGGCLVYIHFPALRKWTPRLEPWDVVVGIAPDETFRYVQRMLADEDMVEDEAGGARATVLTALQVMPEDNPFYMARIASLAGRAIAYNEETGRMEWVP